jgi:hypothetical protein
LKRNKELSFLLYEKLFHFTKIFSVLMSVIDVWWENLFCFTKNFFTLRKSFLYWCQFFDINHRIALKRKYGRTVQCVKFKSVILSVITDGNFDICPICPRGKNGRLIKQCSFTPNWPSWNTERHTERHLHQNRKPSWNFELTPSF